MSESSVISRTGRGSGMSAEEEAFQKLAASLVKLPFNPAVLCGWRAYAQWLEILSGLTLVTEGYSAKGQGSDDFIKLATACGWVRFDLQRETIMVRSKIAYTVEPQPVFLMQSKGMEPDEVRIYDAAVFQTKRRH
mgnify:CR=1 FL=1